jgi:AraC-like DNA-binding protein
MQEAAFLMRDVNMNVSQIAQACGYDDLSYFSRLFRRTYGKSPRKYRQRLLGRA